MLRITTAFAALCLTGLCSNMVFAESREVIHSINAKLRRWVHRTGSCANEVLATFYWSGIKTANGERYNPLGLTAASRHLPFGTILQVSNPHNGLSVSVRINDRGPFTIADIDLSLGAAKALGLKQSSYVCVNTWTASPNNSNVYARRRSRSPMSFVSMKHRGKSISPMTTELSWQPETQLNSR